MNISTFCFSKGPNCIKYPILLKSKWKVKKKHLWKIRNQSLASEYFMVLSIFTYIDRKCPYLIYSLEVMLVWLVCVLSSQPHLIFFILFLKHGRSSMHLQSRTTIGRKTATINEGGVYQINWLTSTHLFQANTSAWTVHSSRAKYPILLWKEKENSKLFIFFNLPKRVLS